MAARYLTALKAGQLVLAKESGDTYQAWSGVFSVSGLDLSGYNGSYGTGLIVPKNAGVPSGANTEGSILFDSTNDNLYVGLGGTSFKQINLSAAATPPTNTTTDAVIRGTGSGWAEETDVKISSAGLITVEATGGLDFNGVNVDIDNSGSFDVLSAGAVALNSSGSTIGIGDQAHTGAISIGTGAAARTITMGNVTGATALVFNSGTGGVDINATTTGNITIDAGATSGLVSIQGYAGSDFTVANAGLTLETTGAGITDVKSATEVQVSTVLFDVNASNAVEIQGAAASFLQTSSGDLTLAATTNSVNITGAEAVADAVKIEATNGAGGIDVNAGSGGIAMDATAGAISLDSALASNFTVTGAGADLTMSSVGGSVVVSASEAVATAITMAASAGGIEIDAALTMDLEVASGQTLKVGTDAVAQTISIGTGAAAKTVTIGTTNTTSATDIYAGSNGLTLNDAVATLDLTGGALTESSLVSVNLTPSGAMTLRGGGVSQFGDDTGYFNFDGAGALSTSGITTMDLDCSGALQINSSGGAISIGNDSVNQAINIGTGGTRTITVGTTNATLDFNAGSGGITMDATSGVIAIGGTAGSSVDLARTGIMTNINGTLLVDEQADFTANVDANLGLDVSGGNLTLDSNDFLVNTNKFTIDGATGDTYIAGNLTVAGSITGIQTIDMIVKDNYMQENVGYVTVSAITGGLVTNYLPTATNDTTNGAFVAGVTGGSPANPYVTTTGSGTFSVGDIIQISGSTNGINDGFFEVLLHTGTKLEVRGIGVTATIEPWSRNQFTAQAAPAPAATIRKVTVSIIRAGTDGDWEVGKGSSSTGGGITYTDLGTTAGITLQTAYDNGNTITTDVGDGNITFNGTEDFIIGGSVDFTMNSTGAFTFSGSNIDLDPTGDFTLDMDATKVITLTMADNLASAFKIQEGANAYLDITTTNGAEQLSITNCTVDVALNNAQNFTVHLNTNSLFWITQDGVGDWIYLGPDTGDIQIGSVAVDAPVSITCKDNSATAFALATSAGDSIFSYDSTDNAEAIVIGDGALTGLTTGIYGLGGLYLSGGGNGIMLDCNSDSPVTIQNCTDLIYTGVDISLDPTGDFIMSMDASKVVHINVADNTAGAFRVSLGDEQPAWIVLNTTDSSEQLSLGSSEGNTYIYLLAAGTGEINMYPSGTGMVYLPRKGAGTLTQMRWDNVDQKGTGVVDGYGRYVYCLCPTGKSATAYQGVAFVASGDYEISGAAADVNQSTVGKMVRGIVRGASAGNTYLQVQIEGFALVEADTAETYDEGDVVKWNKAGKVTTAAKDLGTGYYEELAGVVVGLKDYSGNVFNGTTYTKIQILMMNPAVGNYIPA